MTRECASNFYAFVENLKILEYAIGLALLNYILKNISLHKDSQSTRVGIYDICISVISVTLRFNDILIRLICD